MADPAPAASSGRTVSIKDIGKDKGGASPAEVAEHVLTTVMDGVRKAVASRGIGNTLESLKGVLSGGATEALAGAAKGAKEALTGATGGDGKAADTLKKGAAAAGGKLKTLLGD